jgi:diketogulonate reductase-like aldo/keto reductase
MDRMISPRFLYGTAWKEQDTSRCVRDALRAGFRGIDTANQRVHYHEAAVGEALQQAFAEGVVTREELFVQTKFTPRQGQDHRLPYDVEAPVAEQVRESFESSLEHLATDQVDAYLLHGPFTPVGLSAADREVWQAFEGLHDEGRVARIGVSNVSLEQLQGFHREARVAPAFVQNRCFARTLWDREVREYCRERGIVYQGFSLLTANVPVLRSAPVQEIARRHGKTVPQIVFRFAIEVGMLPLTGTTDPEHMEQDLAVLDFELPAEDVQRIEHLAAD